MRTQVCYAATGFGLAVIAAALADRRLPDTERRVLVLGNTATIPEVAYEVSDIAGMGALLEAFDDVYRYNDAIAPQHPSLWQPRDLDLPILERGLRALWSLEGDIHLVLANLHVEPALNLALIFADATIDVYVDGLAGFGPTRSTPPRQIGVRVQRVLYPDLLPGIRPLLLRELAVEPTLIARESLLQVLATVEADAAAGGRSRSGGPVAVLVGQDLAAQSLLTVDEEQRLHLEMVEAAVAAGGTELVFKPRPSEPAGRTGPLVRRAAELGVHLRVSDGPELVETWYARGSVDLVVSCFSTALATAALYEVRTARVGTELLLERLNPYETANRMAAVVVAATVPPLSGRGKAGPAPEPAAGLSLEQLVTTVGYLMQPSRNPDLRSKAVSVLEQRFPAIQPYVRAERLAQLDLPAGPGRSRRA
jgi:hypothetical protein